MRTKPIRHRYALMTCALLSAVALGTVTASAATASGTSTTKTGTPGTHLVSSSPKDHKQPAHGAFAVAYKPTANAPDDVNDGDPRFAACMREQGQKYYPRFHASKDEAGRVNLRVKLIGGKGFDPTSDAYQDALDTCAPVLEKVGITFPDASDLPPLPEPGKAPPSLHKEKGHPGEPDVPSLTSSAEDA